MKKKYLVILIIVVIFSIMGCWIINVYVDSQKKLNENDDAYVSKAYVDSQKKLNENEIANYISNKLKQIYNENFTAEIYKKDKMVRCGFYFDTCWYSYRVKDAYEYIYKVIDSNGVMAYAYYNDAYYNDDNYHDTSYSDNYKVIKEKNRSVGRYEKVIYDYFTKEEINKIEFSSSESNNYGDNVYLNVYFNYKTIEISSELYGRLNNLSYDINRLITGNGYLSYIGVKAIFLYDTEKSYDDTEKSYSIDSIYGIDKVFMPNNYYEYDFNSLNETKQNAYKDVYNYLTNTIKMTIDDSKNASDAFLKYSQHYIYKVIGMSHKYYGDKNTYTINIENITRENKPLGINLKLIYNQEKNNYVIESVLVVSGSAKSATTVILSNKVK